MGNKRGAKALFSGKAAIDYSKHGDPLYVIIWEEGAQLGFVVRPDPTDKKAIIKVEIPIQKILQFEAAGTVSLKELERFFIN